jgi:hypothetical protein
MDQIRFPLLNCGFILYLKMFGFGSEENLMLESLEHEEASRVIPLGQVQLSWDVHCMEKANCSFTAVRLDHPGFTALSCRFRLAQDVLEDTIKAF